MGNLQAIVEPEIICKKWAIIERAIVEREIVSKWAIIEPDIVGKWAIVEVAENIETVSLNQKHPSKGRKFRTKAAMILYRFHD